MEFTDGLMGGTITAAIVGLVFAVKKLLERSSCSSDSKCCHLDIAAAVESEVRKNTQRDQKELVAMVLAELKKEESSTTYEDNTPGVSQV